MKEIRVIESNKTKQASKGKKRVAAYARVSTKQELQESSLDIQIAHYVKEIIFNKDYAFAGIYYDHGKSGTSMKKRDGLQALLKKIDEGRIDLVLVKSLSRFARNTIDALNVIQDTRKKGVEFYFEKENISSLDTTIDMILTMMAGMAEAESQSMSQNISWGHQKRAEKGIVPLRPVFGYDITKDRQMVINSLETEVIQVIFDMTMKEYPMKRIVEYVKSLDVKTKQGRPINKYTQIKNILTDIRYTGQIIRGKTYTKIEGLEKTRAINDGDRPLYVIKNHHPEIIDLATFDKVQEILSQSKQAYIKRPSRTIDLKNFIFSLNHEAYLHRKQIDVDNSDYDLLENEYQRKSDSPRLYMKTAKHVLKRAMNSLGRNFSDLEAKYDKQVKLLLKEYDLELELITLANLVAGYKQEYYKIKDKKILDSSDTALMFQLEDVITKFSVEYVQLEDKYFENSEMYKYPDMVKKLITSYDYPIQEIDPDMVKSIFSNLVIVDPENYVFIINVTNKKLTMDDMKKAATMKPLLESKCVSMNKNIETVNYKIVLF
ncbi:MAG: hypothetical protein A2Y45_00425 [Tenericutes bacterium GWC2_34_14]|nr:MAG: hypothetical protein A2Y45_00425 [Tenericutes bacterium GWC2_34_14]OHE34465.1 MAG: hypothetical protein A2012_08045 [Tenericutes bacterium GWE2_34_108]OHE35821.1 MAG: hypothetical protein A2Y46_02750 [Tenericutes bacterium GWF1_35_14]OHE39092.1 MAG: hypothetical protein A2Y44_07180 [Tenericutes bacterium GWF2_35_184]OHE42841.1 MAG: hypothetical protein A2221_09055 [Tenericutes bacterium RIFOXYA2_FULL_36_32]OHE44021.1 MAG: hypothetical protein A3K26_09245 [Tenericutes bacterium RIFOXYA1